MKIALIIVVVLVLFGLLFGVKLMGVRNDLVVQREAIAGAWALAIAVKTSVSCFANPFTVSTRFGIKSERRCNTTST